MVHFARATLLQTLIFLVFVYELVRFQIRPCDNGFVAFGNRLPHQMLDPRVAETILYCTVTYCTQRALALVSATSVAGYHLLGLVCLALACSLRGTTHLLSMPLMVINCVVILGRW